VAGAILVSSALPQRDARAQERALPQRDARAQEEKEPDARTPPGTEILQRCASDSNAPVPMPENARGWAVRPAKSYRRETQWLKKKSKHGVQYTLQTVFAPFESALWLNRRFAIVRRVEDVLYLGSDERTYGILPSIGFQSGFGAAIGANVFHKSVLGNRERMAAKVSYGGRFDHLLQLSLDAPQIYDGRFYVEGAFRREGKSELSFYGIGNASEPPPEGSEPVDPRLYSVETRYRQERWLGVLAAGAHFGGPGRRLRAGLSLVYNDRAFYGDAPDEDLDEVFDPNLVVGFQGGEDILELTADLIIDTRDFAGATSSGGLVDAFFGGAPSRDGNEFLHYGVEASYFVTVFRRARVIMARVVLEGVEGNEESIPFTELPRLGGVSRLRGYPQDRYRDDLALVGTLEYQYPIHHTLSGMFFVEAGKVAKTYDELVGHGITDYWHPSFGGGVVVHTLTDVSFRLDLSYGGGFEVFFSSDALAAFRDRRREM